MSDRCALHRALHGAGTATRADVHAAQPQFVADQLGVVVFLAADCMTAPAHGDIDQRRGQQEPRVAHYMEYRVGRPATGGKVETRVFDDFIAREYDVAQHRKQQFPNAAYHLAIHEGVGRCPRQRDLESPVLLDEADLEVLVAFEHGASIVHLAAGVQNREHAAAQQRIEAAFTTAPKLVDFELRQNLEAALRPYLGVNRTGFGHAIFAVSLASGPYFDRRILGRHKPDIDHVRVRHGNTAVRPVLGPIIRLRPRRIIRLAVDHDCAAGIHAFLARFGPIQ